MTSQNTTPERGYRGALPSREDRLARPWILTILAIFVLVIVLSIIGIPSRLIPDPTPVPLSSTPAFPASSSAEASPSESVAPSESASESASPAASESAAP